MPDKWVYNTNKKPCSKARMFLVMEWMLLGFLLTLFYKSVLLASLVSVENEKPIDTLEDMLLTDRKILMQERTSTEILLRTDPRPGIQQLAKKITWFSVSGQKDLESAEFKYLSCSVNGRGMILVHISSSFQYYG